MQPIEVNVNDYIVLNNMILQSIEFVEIKLCKNMHKLPHLQN